MRSRGARHRMHVDGRPRIVGYLLCVMVVLKTAAAAVEQTSAAESTGSSVQVTEYKLSVSTLIHGATMHSTGPVGRVMYLQLYRTRGPRLFGPLPSDLYDWMSLFDGHNA